jgi:hypothetical protein
MLNLYELTFKLMIQNLFVYHKGKQVGEYYVSRNFEQEMYTLNNKTGVLIDGAGLETHLVFFNVSETSGETGGEDKVIFQPPIYIYRYIKKFVDKGGLKINITSSDFAPFLNNDSSYVGFDIKFHYSYYEEDWQTCGGGMGWKLEGTETGEGNIRVVGVIDPNRNIEYIYASNNVPTATAIRRDYEGKSLQLLLNEYKLHSNQAKYKNYSSIY